MLNLERHCVRARSGSAKTYGDFLASGFDQGHRPDLMGGGLIRSSGGWIEARKSQKGDERILGDTSFAMSVLAHAQEKLERRYAMKQSGIDCDTVEVRVTDLFALNPGDLYGQGRSRKVTQARSLFCYWAVRELGLSQTSMADLLSVTEAAITYAVRRGQIIERENGYRLLEE